MTFGSAVLLLSGVLFVGEGILCVAGRVPLTIFFLGRWQRTPVGQLVLSVAFVLLGALCIWQAFA